MQGFKNDPTAKFVVMTASTHMPNSVRAPYRRVAVVELTEAGVVPKMISLRARGVARIVCTWERLSVGLTDRCAYRRGLAEAVAMAAELNTGGKQQV